MRRTLAVLFMVGLIVPLAWGWGADVHRMVTRLALDGLPAAAPDWLRDPAVRERIAFQTNQPDRWRGWDSDVLKNENDPEHYIDVDVLDQFGLTLETVPKMRTEYLRVMAVAKQVHPEKVDPYDPAGDPARIREWPGFLLHAVAEHYAKLQAAFQQVRILEKLNEPTRREQLEQARSITIYHLGILSHFVGDMAQPLHTTKHHHGWVGENPANYTQKRGIHSYIDEGWARARHLGYDTVKPHVKYDAKVNAADPWDDVLEYLRRSYGQLEPLYTLERDGKLDGDEGEKLIVGRLCDAASTLSALIWAAYESAEPTDAQVKSWVRYDGREAYEPSPASSPTSSPAP